MTPSHAHVRLKSVRALDAARDPISAAVIERDLLIDFIKSAKYSRSEDARIALMLTGYADELGERVLPSPPTAT